MNMKIRYLFFNFFHTLSIETLVQKKLLLIHYQIHKKPAVICILSAIKHCLHTFE